MTKAARERLVRLLHMEQMGHGAVLEFRHITGDDLTYFRGLERLGYVTCDADQQHYEITDKGREALSDGQSG